MGDACDPRPSFGGDSIALFEPFVRTEFDAAWSFVGAGAWTLGNDEIVLDSVTTVSDAFLVSPVGGARIAVESRFIVTGGGGPYAYTARGTQGGFVGYVCAAIVNAAVGELASFNAAYASHQVSQSYPLARDIPLTTVLATDGSRVRCAFDAATIVDLDPFLFSDGNAGIGGWDGIYTYHHVVVYALGGAP